MKSQEPFELFGIVGSPLRHTLSPQMQEAAFRHYGLKAYYLALEFEPQGFKKILSQSRKSHFPIRGFNVTVPYKETVMPYLDSVSPEARRIGAVNTVLRSGSKWKGMNTDAYGFLTMLRQEGKFQPRGKKAMILGSGGSARAVIYAIGRSGIHGVLLINRTLERAKILKQKFSRMFPWVDFQVEGLGRVDFKKVLSQVDLVVNTTSVGLKKEDRTLLQAGEIPKASRSKKILFLDLIYRPKETPFLKAARTRGHGTLNGLGMLLHQGAKSFEIWTGKKAPLIVMRKALEDGLAEENRK